ncbi:hypothetical protein FN846DRAFT_904663 [Sphaerosporella brunnea]|uniref:Uncharacterized protein n=1 Tax=Sphaerosporella brunnea TaxID=1250544 RepID=A0A5J5F407_9PEZI|nr:hypothetical protein FN846DRAFT_904663 [Sphaerosporella brunnea]
MSLRNTLYRQYMAIIAHWPVDPLRPNLSFAETLQRRVHRYFGEPAGADSSIPTQNMGSAAAAAPDARKQALKFDAARIQNEMNILGNLLENRFKATYPIGDNMLHPKGNPEYYDKLIEELEAAPQRGWLMNKLSSWKGWIRMD